MLFNNSYNKLPEDFFQRINPIPVKNPQLITFNTKLGKRLGIEKKSNEQLAKIFSGNALIKGSSPIALAYAGHQFGYFVNQLGDGRAVLLGEISTPNNIRYDIQLKGSGQTKFSRQGDGRSPLGPVIREYLISESMNSLRVPTTRSLAAVTTGEEVIRETKLPGGVLTRVAESHIRVGTFEYFAAQNKIDNLHKLADYTINRHFQDIKDSSNKYLSLLEVVCEKQIQLVTKWMGVGFIHGVMNTDNTSIVGETIDYGPCAFMDEYDPAAVFSSIDTHGRYAYGNQPLIAQWNMTCFANCLIPLIDNKIQKAQEKAQEVINNFPKKMNDSLMKVMCKKVGLDFKKSDSDKVIKKLLQLMHSNQSDFTLTFSSLSKVINDEDSSVFLRQFKENKKITEWLIEWKKNIKKQKLSSKEVLKILRSSNPNFIPRNHLIENAITLATKDNDFTEMKKLLSILTKPYSNQNSNKDYMRSPKPEEKVSQTFCGT